MSTKTITLLGDYSHREGFPTELTMRAPRTRDELTASKLAGSPAEMEILLMASVCTVGQDVIEELEITDYRAVSAAYQEFEAGKHLKPKTKVDG